MAEAAAEFSDAGPPPRTPAVVTPRTGPGAATQEQRHTPKRKSKPIARAEVPVGAAGWYKFQARTLLAGIEHHTVWDERSLVGFTDFDTRDDGSFVVPDRPASSVDINQSKSLDQEGYAPRVRFSFSDCFVDISALPRSGVCWTLRHTLVWLGRLAGGAHPEWKTSTS